MINDKADTDDDVNQKQNILFWHLASKYFFFVCVFNTFFLFVEF